MIDATLQLSVAVEPETGFQVLSVCVYVQLALAGTVLFPTQVIDGSILSIRVAVKLQDALFPATSVAVRVIVCAVPCPEIAVPATGLWVTVIVPVQLSETVARLV